MPTLHAIESSTIAEETLSRGKTRLSH